MYVDVRELDEWNEGHLEGAIHCPLSELKKGKIPDLPKDTPLYLYCRSGQRSQIARDILLPHYLFAESLTKGYEELSQQKEG